MTSNLNFSEKALTEKSPALLRNGVMLLNSACVTTNGDEMRTIFSKAEEAWLKGELKPKTDNYERVLSFRVKERFEELANTIRFLQYIEYSRLEDIHALSEPSIKVREGENGWYLLEEAGK